MDSKQELVEEGFGVLGMIREVELKSRLLKSQMENRSLSAECVMDRIIQMGKDLDTYSRRLEEIYKEVSQYDTIDDVPEMDGGASRN